MRAINCIVNVTKKYTTIALDAFFLSRPLLWIPVWGFGIFGFFRAASGKSEFNIRLLWGSSIQFKAFAEIFIFSIAVGIVYIINQIADIEVDRRNKGFALMAHGGLTPKFAWIVVALFFTIGCIASLAFNRELFLFMLAALITGTIYSLRPTYFSGRPIADFLTNAFGYGGIAFGAGWHCAGESIFSKAFILSAVPYFFLMCAGSISSTIPDFEADRKCCKRTTAVVLGKIWAHLVATLFVFAALIASIISKDIIATICAITVVPFYCIYFFRKSEAAIEITYKVGGALSMLYAGVLMPLFALVSFVVYVATLIYFRFRHKVKYPSLVAVEYEK